METRTPPPLRRSKSPPLPGSRGGGGREQREGVNLNSKVVQEKEKMKRGNGLNEPSHESDYEFSQ